MAIMPSNRQIIDAARLVTEVDRIMKARNTPEFFKEPKGFADLMLAAVGHEEGGSDWSVVRKAINLAFIMGVNYDG